jgi:hypothetical protein
VDPTLLVTAAPAVKQRELKLCEEVLAADSNAREEN